MKAGVSEAPKADYGMNDIADQSPVPTLAAGSAVTPPLPVGCAMIETSRRQRFQELVRQWKEATLFVSSITDMAMQPAYQQIIGMGKDALPLLVEELRLEPDHWFWALQAITGVNPVPAQDRGDVAKMTQAWLAWAEQQGL
jgi:hypothetical protein